eukprot:CAMPEP_0173318390 /NCGR_PEP_ID=MMETSP1143-20121109/27631_1 /TAXON_ID=483371 /ORGANISM="non described non described, Strain CCMP2298" /LENGTH=32 /DNA_ID= /DNA_START= /DNA_END= /DNA_ORIENTATION=
MIVEGDSDCIHSTAEAVEAAVERACERAAACA